MSLNENLRKAKRQKNDEFYTQLSDIENELRHYTGHFPGKVVYCNCDDPRVSNFFHYFSYNFERLGLKKALLHDSTAARVGALFQLLVQDTTAQDFGLPSSAIRLRM